MITAYFFQQLAIRSKLTHTTVTVQTLLMIATLVLHFGIAVHHRHRQWHRGGELLRW